MKELTIEDTMIHLYDSKNCFKDDDGYVYIEFSEPKRKFDAKDLSICIFDCPNCKNFSCDCNKF